MARSKRPAGLPDFDNPPLTEVALSVQFDALAPIELAETLAAFWSKLRNNYPETEPQAPLPPVFEMFGVPPSIPRLELQVTATPDMPRFWLVNAVGTEILQIQADRFAHNWRKVGQSDEYPRYEQIRRTFFSEYARLNRIVQARFGRDLAPNQCEVTYVNHISPSDAFGALKFLQIDKVAELEGDPEGYSTQLRVLLPCGADGTPGGRLHVQAGPAITKTGQHVFQIVLIARGRPHSSDLRGARSFMDMGRNAIVKNFTALTTEQMHQAWGRRI